MKRYLIPAVLIATVLIAVFLQRSHRPAETEIGVLMPFSQDFAWWGETIRDSIALSEKDGLISGAKFIYADTKCDTKDAVSAVQSLKLTHPNMHIFVVGCDNDLKAMSPFLDKNKDLAFMVGLSDQSLYGNFPTINLAYRLEAEAAAAAKFASDHLGARTLGIMTDNNNFGGTLAKTAADYFSSIGGKSVTEHMKYNETSPETSILKILQAKPDAVYIQNDIPGMSAILKRFDQLGYKGDRILYYGGRDQSLIKTAGKSAEGIYVPWAISGDVNEKRSTFESEFKATYGKDPFITAYFVRDGLELLGQASQKCDWDARCIEQAFYSAADFSGTLGHVRYEPNGEVMRTFVFEQVKNGEFVEVK